MLRAAHFPTAVDRALVAVDTAAAGQWRRVLHTTNLACGSGRSAGGNSQRSELPRALRDCLQFSPESRARPSVLQEIVIPPDSLTTSFSKPHLKFLGVQNF